jgi:biotin-dependent carboxylase-like uncharacterized protein
MNSVIEVMASGIASTIQDRGRAGYAHLGVSPSGAVDPRLASLTNRLVGNPDAAAVIETCGGLVLRFTGAALIATSSELAPVSIGAGETYRLAGGDESRLWHYVAVRGGVDVPAVLGSRSTDTLSGLGPSPLAAGDRLLIGGEPESQVTVDQAPATHVRDVVRVSPGPRLDWFDPLSFERFVGGAWTVTESSRVGVRLSGLRLVRRVTHDLPSEGLVRGAVQVPPDSDPVMLLADHPTTGGYPVIAVVDPDDVAVVAQTPPGGSVRFTGHSVGSNPRR